MRTKLIAELTSILSRLEIHSPTTFTFNGKFFQTDITTASRALDSNPLASLLQTALYLEAYARRGTAIVGGSPALATEDNLASLLAAANASRERWVPDWRITQILPSGQIVAQRFGLNRLLWPGEFISAEAGGGAPHPGCTISVLWKRESATIQPGFYFAYGETIPDQMEESPLVRFYFNLQSKGAPLVLQLLSTTLNRFRVPFRFKCLSDSGLYPRTDAGVLYVGRRFYRICSELLFELHSQMSTELVDGVPLFCLSLAKGLGLAEDPGTGESFGMARCRLLAQGLAEAFAKGAQSPGARLEMLEAHFKGAGLDMDRPYLNPGSAGDYPWPTS
jgi:hypothetical protein